jgi:hypothetical protein
MQDHPSRAPQSAPSQHATEQALLALLLEHHPGLLTIDEARRELDASASPQAESTRWQIDDASAALIGAGLANRLADAIWASRAAVRFNGLES